MTYPCPDGCGRLIANWTKACFPVAPWDSKGLPPRTMLERCSRHVTKQYLEDGPVVARVLCAYRDDDPKYCATCHATAAKCECGTFGEKLTQPTPAQVRARKRAAQRLKAGL